MEHDTPHWELFPTKHCKPSRHPYWHNTHQEATVFHLNRVWNNFSPSSSKHSVLRISRHSVLEGLAPYHYSLLVGWLLKTSLFHQGQLRKFHYCSNLPPKPILKSKLDGCHSLYSNAACLK